MHGNKNNNNLESIRLISNSVSGGIKFKSGKGGINIGTSGKLLLESTEKIIMKGNINVRT